MENALNLCHTLADKLDLYLENQKIQAPLLVGIHTGGVWVAKELTQRLEQLTDVAGSVDISFYRDDFSQRGLHPQVKGSNLPWDIESRHLILVDDVIKSGRTIRAAMNELFDFGRPLSITLACLVDVGQRELPIQPDVCALVEPLKDNEYIELTGPEPLNIKKYSRTEEACS